MRQIQPKPFIRNSQKVIDRAESSVDNSTALEVSTLSPCIFLAMTKQATVVGEPAIMRIAIIWLLRKPMAAARGRKMAGKRKSLITEETKAPFQRFIASLPENDAPTTKRAMGVAVAPKELRALSSMAGTFILRRAKGSHARIPRV